MIHCRFAVSILDSVVVIILACQTCPPVTWVRFPVRELSFFFARVRCYSKPLNFLSYLIHQLSYVLIHTPYVLWVILFIILIGIT